MNIEFVNHSSFILEQDNLRIICDPWIEGKTFADSWSLIAKTQFRYEDFSTITHIWFSHEHPDHFSPPNLRSIPEQIRKNITILYHYTKDKKVIDYCKKLQFKDIVELPKQEWVFLSNDLKIRNEPDWGGDSWIAFQSKNRTVLNINDCIFKSDKQLEYVKNIVGDIDVLFTQFSYAKWSGNENEKHKREKEAANKLHDILRQDRILQPKKIVPFASYVWHSHVENFYMNDSINNIDYANDFLLKNCEAKIVVLYPKDNWNIDKNHNSSRSIEFWMKDYHNVISKENLTPTNSVSVEQLKSASDSFTSKLKQKNSVLLNIGRPTFIHLSDHNQVVKFSLNGLSIVKRDMEICDISMTSDAFFYCLSNLWGGSTLRVGGRYYIPKNGNYFSFKFFFQIVSLMNNHGRSFGIKSFIRLAIKKIIR